MHQCLLLVTITNNAWITQILVLRVIMRNMTQQLFVYRHISLIILIGILFVSADTISQQQYFFSYLFAIMVRFFAYFCVPFQTSAYIFFRMFSTIFSSTFFFYLNSLLFLLFILSRYKHKYIAIAVFYCISCFT